MRSRAPLLLLLAAGWCASASGAYFGKEIGPLSELHHGVRGRVFAIDSRTLFLQDFHYDGEGPAAYFYVGSTKAPSAAGGARLRDERGNTGPLRRYRGDSLTLSLPDGKTLRDVKWFAVWCDDFSVNFGDVSIPRELDYPRPVKVGALRGVHGVSSDAIVVVDAQTLLVPNFSYDGEAPDAKFWVGRGDAPSPQGIRIPDENGKEAPLRKYDRKTIVLTLPGELTVFDIGHFAIWCEAFTVNFGHVPLPRRQLANVPPSLKMLGVSPQSRNKELAQGSAGASARERKRRPPSAHVDATTYRPHLRPGTGPLAALTDPLSDHTSLHRRADSYTPPAQQLILLDKHQSAQKGSETLQENDDFQQQQTLPQDFQQQQRLPQDYQQQQKLHQDYQQQSKLQADYLLEQQKELYQQQQLLGNRQQQLIRNQQQYLHQTQTAPEYKQQQRLPQHYQQIRVHQNNQQPIHQRNQHIVQPQLYQQIQNENYQQHRSQELYYPEQSFNQQVLYQRPLQQDPYVQQRAYEEALLAQQYRQVAQYRLVPYSQAGSH